MGRLLGRFTTEDPVRSGENWYSYCGGNPVMFLDPMGLERGNIMDFARDIAEVFDGKYSVEIYDDDEGGGARMVGLWEKVKNRKRVCSLLMVMQ